MHTTGSDHSTKVFSYIAKTYTALPDLPTQSVTAYGPQRPDETPTEVRVIEVTGKQLQKNSSNPRHGRWLKSLAASLDADSSSPSCIIEIGTCVGISGMYLLAGMAERNGGHLITFEGSSELSKIAEANFNGLIEILGNKNLSFEIVQGPLDETFTKTISKLDRSISLAFVDGNHQEKQTIEYHNLLKTKMADSGVIVHDDIAWGTEMVRAWETIKEIESNQAIEVLQQGWKPSRGLIRLGKGSTGSVKTHNIDGIFERIARAAKYKLA